MRTSHDFASDSVLPRDEKRCRSGTRQFLSPSPTVTVRFGSSFQRRRGLCAAASPPSVYSKLQAEDGYSEGSLVDRLAGLFPTGARLSLAASLSQCSRWMVSLRSLLSEP